MLYVLVERPAVADPAEGDALVFDTALEVSWVNDSSELSVKQKIV
jgi:hypothetical protein